MRAQAGVIALLIVLLWPRPGRGESACTAVTRQNLIPCVLGNHPAAQVAKLSVKAARGRLLATRPLLPANPVFSVLGAYRRGPDAAAGNYYLTLSQELEIGGQRGRRIAVGDAELGAEEERGHIVVRDLAQAAWQVYFSLLAARAQQALAERLVGMADGTARVARGMADRGLLSPVEADVAEVASVRIHQVRLAAERRVLETSAALATLVGLEPSTSAMAVSGDLVP